MAALVSADPPKGDQTPKEKWAAHVKAARELRGDVLDGKIGAAKGDYKKAVADKIGFSKQQQLKAAVAQLEADRANLNKWEPRDLPNDLKKGEIVKLGLDQTNTARFVVIQVIDDNNMLAKWGNEWYWLEAPTKGLVDDDDAYLTGLVEYRGTRTYKTVGTGSKTIRVIKAHDD